MSGNNIPSSDVTPTGWNDDRIVPPPAASMKPAAVSLGTEVSIRSAIRSSVNPSGNVTFV